MNKEQFNSDQGGEGGKPGYDDQSGGGKSGF
jgi:hypothetical protein